MDATKLPAWRAMLASVWCNHPPALPCFSSQRVVAYSPPLARRRMRCSLACSGASRRSPGHTQHSTARRIGSVQQPCCCPPRLCARTQAPAPAVAVPARTPSATRAYTPIWPRLGVRLLPARSCLSDPIVVTTATSSDAHKQTQTLSRRCATPQHTREPHGGPLRAETWRRPPPNHPPLQCTPYWLGRPQPASRHVSRPAAQPKPPVAAAAAATCCAAARVPSALHRRQPLRPRPQDRPATPSGPSPQRQAHVPRLVLPACLLPAPSTTATLAGRQAGRGPGSCV